MSVVGNNRVGIPIVVLHDCEGAVIEIETKAGELIRGLLFEAEDQMNLYIKNAVIRDVNGIKRKSPQVYVRGTEIVFIILPDMLKHAPMFNRQVTSIRIFDRYSSNRFSMRLWRSILVVVLLRVQKMLRASLLLF